MTTCKYDQFKRTAHPSQSRTNVMFCRCGPCVAVRLLFQRMGAAAMGPGDCEGIKARFKALAWKPEPPKSEADSDAG